MKDHDKFLFNSISIEDYLNAKRERIIEQENEIRNILTTENKLIFIAKLISENHLPLIIIDFEKIRAKIVHNGARAYYAIPYNVEDLNIFKIQTASIPKVDASDNNYDEVQFDIELKYENGSLTDESINNAKSIRESYVNSLRESVNEINSSFECFNNELEGMLFALVDNRMKEIKAIKTLEVSLLN